MTETENVPEWAKQRAVALSNERAGFVAWHGADNSFAMLAFARYIAAHEEAPVDPLLLEAREICARQYREVIGSDAVAERYLRGDFDNIPGDEQACALAGLKRGIELARKDSQ